MKKLLATLKRILPKRILPVLAIATATIVVPATLLAWGPGRPTYTIEHPADHVTFNSIINNPAHGDERNFVQVKPSDAPDSAYAESVNLEAGKEYTVYIYYHNNAASNLNASGKGIAQGAYVRAAVPAVVNGSADVVGHVGATNASPVDVWDEASFKSTSAMAMRFVPGSATIHSFGAVDGKQLGDSIITTGTPLGYDALDGKLPGCNQYAGYVTFKVRADQPNFTVSKTVRLNGTKDWKESIEANAGDTVDYNIEYKNTGTTWQNDVVIKDVLPAGLNYVAGSTKYANASNPSGAQATDEVTTTGINVGNYAPGANVFVKFSAKLPSQDKLVCGPNTFHNIAKAETNNGTKEDSADVTVSKECKPEVKYTCDALTVASIDRTHFKYDTKYTVQNATLKSIQYVVSDEAGKEIARQTSPDYTQDKAGKYTVEAVVTVTVDGQDVVATGACKQPFEVAKVDECKPGIPLGDERCNEKPECKPGIPMGDSRCEEKHENCTIPGKETLAKDSPDCKETPVVPTPSQLPHTGASDGIVALLGAGSLVAAIGYYVASRRAIGA